MTGSRHVPLSAAIIRWHTKTHQTLFLSRTHCCPFFLKHTHLHHPFTRLPRAWPHSCERTCVFKVSMATVSKVIYYSTWSLSGWYTRLLSTITLRPPVISSAHTPSSSSSSVVMNMIYSCLLSSRCSSCSTVCDRLSTSVITLKRGNVCGTKGKAIFLE